jgi:2-oxoglutarate dehydrogenase E2 component (dihydrolipoamide succinyltransferase)
VSNVDVTMPQLGETVAEGTVSRWLLDEGATVTAEEPLLEVSTDKVDTEVVAPVGGVLLRILVPEGETVPVGAVLAQLDSSGRSAAPAPAADTDLTEPGPASPQHAAAVTSLPGDRGHRHLDSPRVRRLARDRGVDLAAVRRSGLHGRATVSDVLAAGLPAPSPSSSPRKTAATVGVPAPMRPAPAVVPPTVDGRTEPLSRRRRVIAERMHRSLLETAQLTTVVEVDLSDVVRLRDKVKAAFRARHGASLSVLAFVAEAAVRTLDEHPIIQAVLDLEAGTVTYPSSTGLGIAVDTEEGLVVPVIRQANDLTVGALARRVADLAARARDGSATADDFAGGTFTITNTGSRGALFDTPILNAPQSAILGLGAVVRRPVALQGQYGDELITVRSMAYLSLTYDHRLIDGADAARFLSAVKERLESDVRSWADSLGLSEGAA